eukprot:6966457-Prymnesium_polylepis.1
MAVAASSDRAARVAHRSRMESRPLCESESEWARGPWRCPPCVPRVSALEFGSGIVFSHVSFVPGAIRPSA